MSPPECKSNFLKENSLYFNIYISAYQMNIIALDMFF